MQLVPKDEAEKNKVGTGRSAPNHSPFLPPPTGRLKFSLNPFKMFTALLGPSLCMKIMCCLICVAFVLLMIFAGPMMNMGLQVYLS